MWGGGGRFYSRGEQRGRGEGVDGGGGGGRMSSTQAYGKKKKILKGVTATVCPSVFDHSGV